MSTNEQSTPGRSKSSSFPPLRSQSLIKFSVSNRFFSQERNSKSSTSPDLLLLLLPSPLSPSSNEERYSNSSFSTTQLQSRPELSSVESSKSLKSESSPSSFLRKRATGPELIPLSSLSFALPRIAQGGLDSCVKSLELKMAGIAERITRRWDEELHDPDAEENEDKSSSDEDYLEKTPTDSGTFWDLSHCSGSKLTLSRSSWGASSRRSRNRSSSPPFRPSHREAPLRPPNSLSSHSRLRPLLLRHRTGLRRRGSSPEDSGVRRRRGLGAAETG